MNPFAVYVKELVFITFFDFVKVLIRSTTIFFFLCFLSSITKIFNEIKQGDSFRLSFLLALSCRHLNKSDHVNIDYSA